jgi:hypothetical protein
MHTIKYAPTAVFQYVNSKGFQQLPVTAYVVHAPGVRSSSCPIRSDCWALEMRTVNGPSWQGFDNAPRINSELRMVIDITGRERDQVLCALPDCHVK